MGKMYRRWDKFEVQDVIARYLSGEDVQAIAEEYGRADVLEALGLRIQFYIDGRVRLYLAN